MDLDLKSAFELGLKSYGGPRGDEAAAHVSDLSKCLFEVWGRRNAEPQVQRGAKSLAAMQSGLRDETWIIDRIERGLTQDGWRVFRSGELPPESDLTGHIDAELARAKCPVCEAWMRLSKETRRWSCPGYCVGQVFSYDYELIAIERSLIEVKTTEWKEEWFETGEYRDTGMPIKARRRVPWPDSPKLSHRLQAMGYVQRRPRNPDGRHMPFAIIEWCRSSFALKVDWFDGEDPVLLALHAERTRQVIEGTGPGIDPVKAGVAFLTRSGGLSGLPREKWQCGYCSHAMCASNVSKDNEAIPV